MRAQSKDSKRQELSSHHFWCHAAQGRAEGKRCFTTLARQYREGVQRRCLTVGFYFTQQRAVRDTSVTGVDLLFFPEGVYSCRITLRSPIIMDQQRSGDGQRAGHGPVQMAAATGSREVVDAMPCSWR